MNLRSSIGHVIVLSVIRVTTSTTGVTHFMRMCTGTTTMTMTCGRLVGGDMARET